MTKAVAAAEKVLEELSISDVSDLRRLKEIAWVRGAFVRRAYLKGAEARLTVSGDKAVITISTTILNHQRQRFSIAHELGHLEIHRHRTSLTLCVSDDMEIVASTETSKPLEYEANEFAAELLLPKRFFAEPCLEEDPSLDFISDLAERFDVSLTATALKYLEYCEEPVAIVYSEDGFIRWFQRSEPFKEMELFVDVRGRVDRSSVARYFFDGLTLPLRSRRIPADAWLREGNYRDNARILEQSRSLSSNSVLTLLWIDNDIEPDGWY